MTLSLLVVATRTRRGLPRIAWLTACAAVLTVLASCASGPAQPGFSKIKDYHLKEDDRRAESMSIDPMLRFERQHFLHGAVTEEARRERFGNYYTFLWNAPPSQGPVTLRFDYRQSRAGERVFTYEQTIADVKERNLTSIRISGPPYHRFGPVVAWEATLSQNGQVLDSTRSFLWN